MSTPLNAKFIISSIALLLICSIIPGSAVTYHFFEDFEDLPHQNWYFTAYCWPNSSVTSQVRAEHSFTFESELAASGTANSSIILQAILQDDTVQGAWSFDVFVPQDPLVDAYNDTVFRVGWWQFRPSQYFGEPNSTVYLEYKVYAVANNIILEGLSSFQRRLKFFRSPGLKFGVYQHVDIIRTEERFKIYLDKEIMIDQLFNAQAWNDIHYVDFTAPKGSGVKFDNITITSDYARAEEELPQPSSGVPPWLVGGLAGIGLMLLAIFFIYYMRKRGRRIIPGDLLYPRRV